MDSLLSNSKLTKKKQRISFWKKLWNNRALVLMCMPVIVFFFVFSYLTMPGLYLAFVKYNYNLGIFKSTFVGMQNFKFLWMTGELLQLTKNTILYNIAFILLGNITQILMAILLNEINKKWYRKVSQTVMFLPHFISYVLVGLFAYSILSFDYGILNKTLQQVGLEKLNVYGSAKGWPIIITLVYIWKSTGYGTIVYFAAITGLDPQMYEAAEVDGANAFQRIRHITLPCLKPTFIILLLFALGGIMRGNFALFYNLVGRNPLLFSATDIIETYVFRALMVNFNFSTGAAVGLYQSIFGFVLVMTVNWIVRRIEPEYALF